MVLSAWLAVAAAAATSIPAASPTLSPAETRMVASVDADRERSVALLERVVNQNSGGILTFARRGAPRPGPSDGPRGG